MNKLKRFYEVLVYRICLFLVGYDGILEEAHKEYGKKSKDE
jgi:hypothetical protein